jgi:hypothetical protein
MTGLTQQPKQMAILTYLKRWTLSCLLCSTLKALAEILKPLVNFQGIHLQ